MGIFDFINKKREENNENVMEKSGSGDIRLLDYLRLSKNKLGAYEFAALVNENNSVWMIDRMGRNSQSIESAATALFTDPKTVVNNDGEINTLENIVIKYVDPELGTEDEARFTNPMDFIYFKMNEGNDPTKNKNIEEAVSNYLTSIIVDASGVNSSCDIYCPNGAPASYKEVLENLANQVRTYNEEIAMDPNSKVTYGDMINNYFIKLQIKDSMTGMTYSSVEELPENFFAQGLNKEEANTEESSIKR